MIKTDFHVHTVFCDGKNSPEEMVIKAISLGLKAIGLVCHAFTLHDVSYCIKRENIFPFIAEIARLKVKYKNHIKIFCGVEYDYFADMDISKFDFCLGAVHYVYNSGAYIDVDASKQAQIDCVNKFYGGDFYAFCEDYYSLLGDIYSKCTPSFIAHFDLVSKFNESGDLFDENHPRYIKAWKTCADKLLENNAVFELNLGGILRGYKITPYPNSAQIKYIIEKGGKFIINGDCHTANNLDYDYQKYVNLIGEENLIDIDKIFGQF